MVNAVNKTKPRKFNQPKLIRGGSDIGIENAIACIGSRHSFH